MSLHTFERDPVMFPFAPGCKFHFLVFLMNQEVFHRQGPRLPYGSLCAANQRVWWIGAAECAAASLITLLRAVPTSLMTERQKMRVITISGRTFPFKEQHPFEETDPGLIVQLLSEVLVHAAPASLAASSLSSSCAAAAAVAAVEDAALGSRVDRKRGGHGLTAAWQQLSIPIYLRGDPIDTAVAVLASLAQSTRYILSGREATKCVHMQVVSYTLSQSLSGSEPEFRLPKFVFCFCTVCFVVLLAYLYPDSHSLAQWIYNKHLGFYAIQGCLGVWGIS